MTQPTEDLDLATVVTHADPAWRDRANYILMADLADFEAPGRFEQLWLTDLGNNRFRLCCLPFFTYGYSLGDVVETKAQGGQQVLGRVVETSGRGLIRLVFHSHGTDHEAVHAALAEAGCLSEWRGDGYVAIDFSGQLPDGFKAVVERLAKDGALQWEDAGSRDIAQR